MADALPNDRLFVDHLASDIEAGVAIFVGAMIAAGGGLGGGGVFVPIYILIQGLPPKFAAALSQATIFGGSIVNFIMNLQKTHPTRSHRPLTDFATLLMFEPMLLAGTIIGVLLNVICPDIVILILLALVLTYATTRTTRKGIQKWKAETIELREKANQTSIADQSQQTMDASTAQSTATADIEMQTEAQSKATTNNRRQTLDVPDDLQMNSKIRCLSMSVASSVDGDEASMQRRKSSADSMDASRSDLSTKSSTTNKEKQELRDLAKQCGVRSSQIDTAEKVELCEQIIERESQILRPMNLIALVWIVVSLFALAKKENITGVDELNVRECSLAYWMVTFLPLPFMMGISYLMARKEYKQYQVKINSACWEPAGGDIPFMMGISYLMARKEYKQYQVKINSACWEPAGGDIDLSGSFVRILKYPLIATVAGLLGGLLGIGGGMIVSPLLIELGVKPTVAAATSAMAVLITSSSAMLQFLLLGYLQFDYTFFFMAVGIVGTFVGQTAVNFAVKKYGRVSVVVFAVATIMALAIVLMTVNGVMSMIDGVSW
eukprot:CAMPEP_0197073234 /NCGR_PEP_ID=MMETSP1384-20130603/210498_1 /TAXON_ID=29189 /ORGANISM="Ammonia sp." /LENGTH=549 /DNA_ID=CAMNT_0042512067 /DNA_START=33 /DNA_END=1679 /DNA_ORIENTATION=+